MSDSGPSFPRLPNRGLIEASTTQSGLTPNNIPFRDYLIAALCQALDRDRSWVINQAINKYLEEQQEELKAIEEGIADLDAGRWFTTAQMVEKIQRKARTLKEQAPKHQAKARKKIR